MKYDVDFFIRKFSRIPKDRWTVGAFKRSNGKRCALGHCGEKEPAIETEISLALKNMFKKRNISVVSVNDGQRIYRHHHPKDRILAALMDIKKMNNKERNENESG